MSNRLMQGTYSDFKLIKGRKVCQMIIEFPSEAADTVAATFGMPQPHIEKWVAVALLNEQAVVKNQNASKAIQEAGILCKEPRFGSWLRESRGMTEVDPADPNTIAEALRAILGVRSRADLSSDNEALQVWYSLKSSYDNYLLS